MRKSRIRQVATVAAFAAAGLLAACSSSTPANPGNSSGAVKLVYSSYGGTGQAAQEQAWQQPYTKLHPNVTFNNVSPPDASQVKAQVESNQVTWNIVTTAPYLAAQNCGTLYQPLNIPNLDTKDFPPGTIGKCYVTDFRYSLVLSYNAKIWPNPKTAPTTLADFFDPQKFPGKRGVVPSVQDGILETALLADGVSPQDMYPLNVNEALQTWDKIKSDTIFAPSVGALLQDVTSHQVAMEIMVQARTQAALDEGADIVPVWDKTVTSIDGLAIPKGAANLQATEQFMSFLLQPAQQAKMAELAGVAPSNLLAKPVYTANGNKVNAFGKADTGTTFQVNAQWWSSHFNQISTEFTNWLNG